MSQQPQRRIEFINGPFDGHVEMLTVQPEKMPESLICYVNENVFRLFHGETQASHYSITSVAFYKRRYRATGWVYAFVGAVAPHQVRISPAP